jgi:hypothetical protein
MESRRFLGIKDARTHYGGSVAAWRKWVRLGQLGSAVVRFGRLVFLDSVVLDERIAKTGRLLVNGQDLDAKVPATVPAASSASGAGTQ